MKIAKTKKVEIPSKLFQKDIFAKYSSESSNVMVVDNPNNDDVKRFESLGHFVNPLL